MFEGDIAHRRAASWRRFFTVLVNSTLALVLGVMLWLGVGVGVAIFVVAVAAVMLNAVLVAHEGAHVANAQSFVSSISRDGRTADMTLDLTTYQDELSAYEVTAASLSQGGWAGTVGGRLLGAGVGPADTLGHINAILADPKGPYKVTPQRPGPPMIPFPVPHWRTGEAAMRVLVILLAILGTASPAPSGQMQQVVFPAVAPRCLPTHAPPCLLVLGATLP